MIDIPIHGLGTALITPFKADLSIDYEALDRLLDAQLNGCVDYIVVLGTTGEAATLTHEEKQKVRKHIVDYVSGRLPLVLGVGGNCTSQVLSDIDSMRHELTDSYTAILSVCPYYNKPSQDGLFQHFYAIAEASPIPVILYNVPGRTGVNLLPKTVMRIYDAHPHKIIGIKEASGDIEQIKSLIRLANNKLLVISGDDAIACKVIKAGGNGLISVASNAFAEDFYCIVHEQDENLQEKYAEMIKLLFAEGNPVGIKAVLAQKGIIGNHLRLPLVPASIVLQQQIANKLKHNYG